MAEAELNNKKSGAKTLADLGLATRGEEGEKAVDEKSAESSGDDEGLSDYYMPSDLPEEGDADTDASETDRDPAKTSAKPVRGIDQLKGRDVDTIDDSEVEKIARAMQWRPDGPLDARTFLKRGSQKRSALYQEIERSQEEIASLKETMDAMHMMMREMRHKGTEQNRQEVMAAKRDAIDAGDHERVEIMEKQLRQLDAETKAPNLQQEAIDKAVLKFQSQNKYWLNKDASLNRRARNYFIARSQELEKNFSNQYHSYDQIFEDAKEDTLEKFPQLFDNPERHRAPRVESGKTKSSVSSKGSVDARIGSLDKASRANYDYGLKAKWWSNFDEYLND